MNTTLLSQATSLVKTKITKGGMIGDVGCALLASNGKTYTGVCASTGSNTFCAEQAAIGSMITDGEYIIHEIIAVWKDEEGKVFIIPPCGNCRQMMREISEDNLEITKVTISPNTNEKLKNLLPYYDSWEEIN